jgi:hypothetical protein
MINGYSWICLLEAFGLGVLCLGAFGLVLALVLLAATGVQRVINALEEEPPYPVMLTRRACRKLHLNTIAKWGAVAIFVAILAGLLTQVGLGILRSIGTSCKVG